MEKNEILMIHGKDYKEMTKRLLREAELDTRIPDRRCRIGIKPNLVSVSYTHLLGAARSGENHAGQCHCGKDKS